MVMTQNYPVYFDTAKIPLEHFFPSLDRKYLEKRFSKYESKHMPKIHIKPHEKSTEKSPFDHNHYQ